MPYYSAQAPGKVLNKSMTDSNSFSFPVSGGELSISNLFLICL